MSAETLERASLRQRARKQGAVLLEHIEQFALLKRPNLQQIKSVKEMFYALARKTNAEQRRKMSILLSRSPYAPRSIILFLSMNPVEISSPVLLFSPVLNSKDLCNIINKMPMDHARVIARRDNIDVNTISALLNKDDSEEAILKVIKQNVSAKQSLEAYRNKTLETSTNHAAGSPYPAVVPGQVLQSESLRTTEPALKDAGRQLVEVAARGGKLGRSGKPDLSYTQSKPSKTIDASLILAARSPEKETLGDTLHAICGIAKETVRSHIENSDVGSFACLLSAIGINATTAGRILLLQFPALGRDKAIFDQVIEQYRQLDRMNTIAFFKKIDDGFRVPGLNGKPADEDVPFGLLLNHRRNTLHQAMPNRSDVGKNVSSAKSA